MFPSVVDFADEVICLTCIIPILSLHLAVSQNLVQEKHDVVDAPHFALLVHVGLLAKRCQQVLQVEVLFGILGEISDYSVEVS